jgi:hypothetical protein
MFKNNKPVLDPQKQTWSSAMMMALGALGVAAIAYLIVKK